MSTVVFKNQTSWILTILSGKSRSLHSIFNIPWFIWAKSTFKTRNPKYSKKKLHHEYVHWSGEPPIPTFILSTAPRAESSLLPASPHFSHPHLCTSQEELSEQEYFLLPHNLSHSVILEPTFSQKSIADFISPVKKSDKMYKMIIKYPSLLPLNVFGYTSNGRNINKSLHLNCHNAEKTSCSTNSNCS